jgi:hypothetical protein
MIDDEHVHWLSGRFQLQTELLRCSNFGSATSIGGAS